MKKRNTNDICNLNKQPLTMIELFSGIGSQIKGTKNTNLFDVKVIATSDIEKDAMLSYAAIHNGLTDELIKSYKNYPSEKQMIDDITNKNIGFDFNKGTNPISRMRGYKLKKYWLAMTLSNNLGDISKINKLPAADFWTYSFPCQSISISGKQEGIIKGKTRSGLLYEVERLLEVAKKSNSSPKYLLLENVKNLVGEKFFKQFNEWIARLDELGYNTYWKVLNAEECGVPQHRERVFAISIRKDIDTGKFEFPKPFDNNVRLKDLLEENVPDKFYLSEFVQSRLQITDRTLTRNIVGTTKPSYRKIGQRDIVYHTNKSMSTLTATDYKQPKQIIENYNLQALGILPIEKGQPIPKLNKNKIVRMLMPIECYRLTGFDDADYEKVTNIGVSDNACYKQTGNSIVTTCIKLIMEHLYKAQYNNLYICSDEK